VREQGVSEVLQDQFRLALVDETGCFAEELFRVLAQLREDGGLDPGEDRSDGAACELGALGNLSNDVVLHLGGDGGRLEEGVMTTCGEAAAAVDVLDLELLLLRTSVHGVAHPGDVQGGVQCRDRGVDERSGVEVDLVGGTSTNPLPEPLELLSAEEGLVQRDWL